MEKKVSLASKGSVLEGLIHRSSSTMGVVITHPHPLYGGDMFNPVVEAIATAYRKTGFTILRFNFRGTGSSTGRHDEGVGEQADVAAAIDYLKDDGLSSIHLSGYSFGAWVNAMAIQGGLAVDGLTMVAPPVAFIDFAGGIRLPCLSAVVTGSRDEIAPPGLVRPLLNRWNPQVRMDTIDGADHFFSGFLEDVSRMLVKRLQPVA